MGHQYIKSPRQSFPAAVTPSCDGVPRSIPAWSPTGEPACGDQDTSFAVGDERCFVTIAAFDKVLQTRDKVGEEMDV